MRNLIFIIFVTYFSAMADEQVKYPELKGFEVYGKGNWSKIVPGKTTVKEVLDLLGEGSQSEYLSSLLIYEGTKKFKVYIYMSKPVTGTDSVVKRVDFIPKTRTQMGNVAWPENFKNSGVRAADARWNEFTDKSGLVYEVYTTKTPYGGHVPGDLNRISYRVPMKEK